MNVFDALPALLEAPAIVVLAIAVLVMAYALLRALSILPSASHKSENTGAADLKQALEGLQTTIDDLERTFLADHRWHIKEEAELQRLKALLAEVEQARQQAAQDRDRWQREATDLEQQVQALEVQIDLLSQHLLELHSRDTAA